MLYLYLFLIITAVILVIELRRSHRVDVRARKDLAIMKKNKISQQRNKIIWPSRKNNLQR